MTESQLIVAVLIEGAVGGLALSAVAFLLSRFAGDAYGRGLLVIILIVAAAAYFGFAVAANAGPGWALVELAQCVVYGAMGLRGLRGSPHWLAAGWALHPVWDFGLHYVGPGRSFAPVTYAIACVSFDLLVAAYVLVVYRLGPHANRDKIPEARG